MFGISSSSATILLHLRAPQESSCGEGWFCNFSAQSGNSFPEQTLIHSCTFFTCKTWDCKTNTGKTWGEDPGKTWQLICALHAVHTVDVGSVWEGSLSHQGCWKCRCWWRMLVGGWWERMQGCWASACSRLDPVSRNWVNELRGHLDIACRCQSRTGLWRAGSASKLQSMSLFCLAAPVCTYRHRPSLPGLQICRVRAHMPCPPSGRLLLNNMMQDYLDMELAHTSMQSSTLGCSHGVIDLSA